MSIGADDGPVIEIDGSEIRVGGAGAEALVKRSELDTLVTLIKAHTHLDPVSGSTGTPSNQGAMTAGTGTVIAKGV
jgi:hypothetical protein